MYYSLNSFRYIIQSDFTSECRANVTIEKGAEITDFYVSPLYGTRYRRKHLKDGWFFDCKCKRCSGLCETG